MKACRISRRGRKWPAAAALTMLLLAAAIIVPLNGCTQPDQKEVLRVNGESVSISEAMVYYELMRTEFERIGTEEIWDLEIIGLDPQQTAMDRVLESIVRVKVIQSLGGSLKSSEEQNIREKADHLASVLGEAYMEKHCIDQPLLEKIVRENYQAYRYEQDAKFLPGSNEEEIENKLKETFAAYEYLDQRTYLQSAAILPMMFYTGEWVEGEWVSYSEAQKALILEEAAKLRENLTPANFREISRQESDCWTVEGNPVFEQGAIRHPRQDLGIVYYGQMEQETAEAIFSTPPGEITDILETPYGYLIVRVVMYPAFTDAAFSEYEEQLRSARETERARIINELKKQRLEEEWQRLEEESEIQYFSDVWEEYIRQNLPAS